MFLLLIKLEKLCVLLRIERKEIRVAISQRSIIAVYYIYIITPNQMNLIKN